SACLVQQGSLSTAAIMTISYCGAALLVVAFFYTWMSENKLTTPRLSLCGPVARPIFFGLAASCGAALAATALFSYFHLDVQLSAQSTTIAVRTSAYDKWCILGMWVVAAPLFEEWLLRGMLYRSLRRNWSVLLSVGVSALLFATLHPVAGCVSLVTL